MKRIDLIAQNGNEGLHYIDEQTGIHYPNDTIVNTVLDKYKERSKVGKEKYGTTMDRNDLNVLEWLTHLQEELMDATLYVEKLKKELKP